MNELDRNRFRGTLVALAPYVLLMLAQLCWASNVVIGRAVREDIPPVTLTCWRWVAVLAILLPLAWLYIRKDLHNVVGNWRLVSLLSLFVVVSNFLIYFAVHTPAAHVENLGSVVE